jgi:hypothetical protein
MGLPLVGHRPPPVLRQRIEQRDFAGCGSGALEEQEETQAEPRKCIALEMWERRAANSSDAIDATATAAALGFVPAVHQRMNSQEPRIRKRPPLVRVA